MPKKVNLCYWAVAFIDLLGQGEKMKDVSNLLEQEEIGKAIDIMEDLYRTHVDLYDSFANEFNDFHNRAPTIQFHDKIEEQAFLDLRRCKLQYQRFSDSLMFFVPLRTDDEDNLPMRGISHLMHTLAVLLPTFLAKGRPFRCGMDVGYGIEVKAGELCGPAVMRAYELESKVAQYPRIVIGNGLVQYFHDIPNIYADNTPKDIASRDLAEQCLKWITEDTDGNPIIHYLGKEMTEDQPKVALSGLMGDALTFIENEHDRFRNLQNSKLAFRYSLLHNYFVSFSSNWKKM